MAAPYLTASETTARLSTRFNLNLIATPAMCEVASDALDLKAPFVGNKLLSTQHREFPRDTNVQDDPPGQVPPRILDWVALRCYQLSNEDDAPIIREQLDTLAVQYARGKRSRVERIMRDLLRHYRAGSWARIR